MAKSLLRFRLLHWLPLWPARFFFFFGWGVGLIGLGFFFFGAGSL